MDDFKNFHLVPIAPKENGWFPYSKLINIIKAIMNYK